MLNLFKSIFSQSDAPRSDLPGDLLKAAIERAVDGTDPRVRIQPGYAKALRKPVTHALRHVIGLVDDLPAPVTADKKSLAEDPAFAALCYSEARMARIISRDAAMREFRATNPPGPDHVFALLLAQRSEKHGFGYAQVGDRVQSDVPRTTVGFDQHRLVEPAISEQETRRLLKRRAFDHLLSVALLHITGQKQAREKLGKQKALLRTKLDILRRGSGLALHTSAPEQFELQERLTKIDAQLSRLGPAEDTLSDNLAMIAAVLAEAESHLWSEDTVLYLDKLYVLHDEAGPSAPPVTFRELRNSEGQALTALMIAIPPQSSRSQQ